MTWRLTKIGKKDETAERSETGSERRGVL